MEYDTYLYVYKCSCKQCLLQLYLRHDFYNNFKIQHKIYIAPGSAPTSPQWNILSVRLIV